MEPIVQSVQDSWHAEKSQLRSLRGWKNGMLGENLLGRSAIFVIKHDKKGLR